MLIMFPSTQPLQPLPPPEASPVPAPARRTGWGASRFGSRFGAISQFMRDSAGQAGQGAAGYGGGTALSELSASLMQDLMRFERSSDQRELLEVLAACLRHTQDVAVRLAWQDQEMTLSVFPRDALLHCPLPIGELLRGQLASLRVLAVQPAALRPPGSAELARVGNPAFYAPLAPLLWAVALRGSRATLLPELAGQAAYRVAPGLNLNALPLQPAEIEILDKLSRRASNLREIADWYGIGRERAARLLNALYLQSGLIVSRSHPAATNEGWAGYR